MNHPWSTTHDPQLRADRRDDPGVGAAAAPGGAGAEAGGAGRVQCGEPFRGQGQVGRGGAARLPHGCAPLPAHVPRLARPQPRPLPGPVLPIRGHDRSGELLVSLLVS